jgi:hypothetical protein
MLQLKSAIEAYFRNGRIPVEITHAGSIYENRIETFQESNNRGFIAGTENLGVSLFLKFI